MPTFYATLYLIYAESIRKYEDYLEAGEVGAAQIQSGRNSVIFLYIGELDNPIIDADNFVNQAFKSGWDH